jgi:hypothetical protein
LFPLTRRQNPRIFSQRSFHTHSLSQYRIGISPDRNLDLCIEAQMTSGPVSQRSSRFVQKAPSPIKATIESSAMKEFAEYVIRVSKAGKMVPLIVPDDDGLEFYSFVKHVTRLTDEHREYVLINNDGELYQENPLLRFGQLPHILLMGAEKTRKSVLEALAKELEEANRVRILRFRLERDCCQTLSMLPGELVRSIRDPRTWPSLRDREADFPGVIQAICGSFTSVQTKKSAILTRQAQDFLCEQPGESIVQLEARIRKAFAIACEAESDTVEIRHLRAVDRPDVRTGLRLNKRSISPTPSSYG